MFLVFQIFVAWDVLPALEKARILNNFFVVFQVASSQHAVTTKKWKLRSYYSASVTITNTHHPWQIEISCMQIHYTDKMHHSVCVMINHFNKHVQPETNTQIGPYQANAQEKSSGQSRCTLAPSKAKLDWVQLSWDHQATSL